MIGKTDGTQRKEGWLTGLSMGLSAPYMTATKHAIGTDDPKPLFRKPGGEGTQRRSLEVHIGLLRELNPGPLAPEARIMPLDQAASANVLDRRVLTKICRKIRSRDESWGRVVVPLAGFRPKPQAITSSGSVITWPVGLMDKASASGAGDSRFESWAGHFNQAPMAHAVA